MNMWLPSPKPREANISPRLLGHAAEDLLNPRLQLPRTLLSQHPSPLGSHRSTMTSHCPPTSPDRHRITLWLLQRTPQLRPRPRHLHAPKQEAPWHPSTRVDYLLADNRWRLWLPQLIPKAVWHSPRAGSLHSPRIPRSLPVHRLVVPALNNYHLHLIQPRDRTHRPRDTSDPTLCQALVKGCLDAQLLSWAVTVTLKPQLLGHDPINGTLLPV